MTTSSFINLYEKLGIILPEKKETIRKEVGIYLQIKQKNMQVPTFLRVNFGSSCHRFPSFCINKRLIELCTTLHS